MKDKVVLISGGLGRIGSALVQEIVLRGGKIVLGDVLEAEGAEFSKKLGGPDVVFFQKMNITEPKDLNAILELAHSHFGHVDAAVHCAYPRSQGWGQRLEDLDPKFLEKDLFMQLGGAILFSQAVCKYFASQKQGQLIHLSSIQGVSAPKFEHYEGTSMFSPIEYTAIKAGVIALTKWLAKYYKNQNIQVNCVSFGGIKDNQPQIFLDQYKKSCCSKGMLDPQDIVGTILFIISKEAQYINGQNIILDDGWCL
jgi:NAD(P)-dependent dehydrogenase (short-subunit alcohol dehydrogenase family)